MQNTSPPKDQRAGVRPIAFVLQENGRFSAPVTLKIRPEDLNRVEPSRVAITQTLGRNVSGWVDNFGEGLPSLTISGHTGWRQTYAGGKDGAAAFEQLNQLVAHDYHKAKQRSIDNGLDPSLIKLLFVDMLDNFTWSVVPTQFVLRRSKSRPLLFQYQIALQAVSTNIDEQFKIVPIRGSVPAGINALSSAIVKLQELSANIQSIIEEAVSYKDAALMPVGKTIADFAAKSLQVFNAVNDAVLSVQDGVFSSANSLISIAADLAAVGININRTISSVAGLPSRLMSAISRVAAAYNEVLCIFSNSLRPRKTYNDYDGLFGASNCSSTTGGRLGSSYSGSNAFQLMQTSKGSVGVNSSAYSSISTVGRADPVLAPMSIQEIDRNLTIINNGVEIK
jgi:hypothetical protein